MVSGMKGGIIEHKPEQLLENSTEAIVWISFLLVLFDTGLAGYSIWKKQNTVFLLPASCLVIFGLYGG